LQNAIDFVVLEQPIRGHPFVPPSIQVCELGRILDGKASNARRLPALVMDEIMQALLAGHGVLFIHGLDFENFRGVDEGAMVAEDIFATVVGWWWFRHKIALFVLVYQ
jgi:hypothetical protein